MKRYRNYKKYYYVDDKPTNYYNLDLKNFVPKFILDERPQIHFSTISRKGRDSAMMWIGIHLEESGINGNALVLAAERIPETVELFKFATKNSEITNVERDEKYFNLIDNYTKKIKGYYSTQGIDIRTIRGTFLGIASLPENKNKYSIIDYDDMSLFCNDPDIENFPKILSECTKDRFVFSWSHCAGRGKMGMNTNEKIDQVFTPRIISAVKQQFNIRKYNRIRYKDGQIPMIVDIFTLEKKNANREPNTEIHTK